MRLRLRPLAFPFVLGAVLVSVAPQQAAGQTRSTAEQFQTEDLMLNFLTENVTLNFDVRPGVEVRPGESLGTLLAERIRVSSSEGGRPINLGLWVETISAREGSVGRYESSPFEIEPGRTYPGKAWIRQPTAVDEALAPGFGERRKEGTYVVINHEEQYTLAGSPTSKAGIAFPDVCKDASYALVIGVSAPEVRGDPSAGKSVVCLGE